VATAYGLDEGRAVSAFSNSLPLRLLDLRYMKHILREIFESNERNESALPVILSFGLCSFYHQYQLAKRRFKDSNLTEQMTALQKYYKDDPLFEQSGIRIAETTNDSYMMGFLRGIFSSFADGFLCPSLRPTNISNRHFMPV